MNKEAVMQNFLRNFFIVLYLPGTFLHELSHAFVTILVGGKLSKFTIFPRIEEKKIVYGSVSSLVDYHFKFILIGLAPLVWWGLLIYLILHTNFYLKLTSLNTFSFEIFLDLLKILFFSIFSWETFLFVQLFWAGTLSKQDIKVALGGLFSISGLIFSFIIGMFLFYGFKTNWSFLS